MEGGAMSRMWIRRKGGARSRIKRRGKGALEVVEEGREKLEVGLGEGRMIKKDKVSVDLSAIPIVCVYALFSVLEGSFIKTLNSNLSKNLETFIEHF